MDGFEEERHPSEILAHLLVVRSVVSRLAQSLPHEGDELATLRIREAVRSRKMRIVRIKETNGYEDLVDRSLHHDAPYIWLGSA